MSKYKIAVNEKHMDELVVKYKRCSGLVDEIIVETKKMRNIMNSSYEGIASEGIDDLLRLLGDHVDTLNMCYKQLSEYTRISKETIILRDLYLGKILSCIDKKIEEFR